MRDINLKKDFRDLEVRVLSELRTLVENSNIKSKYVLSQCLKLKDCDYEEMVLINERLTLLDKNGLHYSVFDTSLETLIDITISQN